MAEAPQSRQSPSQAIPLLTEDKSVPLCVDLDGTLIHEDTTRTAFFLYCGRNPWRYLKVAGWFLYKRHAYMKQKLAEHIDLTGHTWTFSQSVLTMMRQERAVGRQIYLVSATDIAFAKSVVAQAPYQEFFTNRNIFASKGLINYRADAKAQLLDEQFGEANFVYIGNSSDDLKVWSRGQTPVVVSYKPNNDLVTKARHLNQNAIILQEY